MTSIDESQLRAWISNVGISLRGNRLLTRSADLFRLESTQDYAVASAIARVICSELDARPALCWVTSWNLVEDIVAQTLLEALSSLTPLPARVAMVSTDDHAKVVSFLTLAILAGWDAYLVPAHGDFYAMSSHDGVLYIVPTTEVKSARVERVVVGLKEYCHVSQLLAGHTWKDG